MNMKDAMALIREKRPDADPIPAFISQLQAYEKKCNELGVISKDSAKRKIDELDQKKKKQRRIGPAMGPQRVIGPSLPANPSPAATEHDSKIYGPQLPTAVALGDGLNVDPQEDSREKGGEVARERRSPNVSIIGPSLPTKHEVNE